MTSVLAAPDDLELHVLAFGIRPLTVDGRDATVRVTTYDPRFARPASGVVAVEPHAWGGWSVRYQPSLKPRRTPVCPLWVTSPRHPMLTRRVDVTLAAEPRVPYETTPHAEEAVRAELSAIRKLPSDKQRVRRERLDRIRSIPLVTFLAPWAPVPAGASAFGGVGPPWARLIARRTSSNGPIVGLGQCAENGEFLLPIFVPAALYRSQLKIWVEVVAPTAPLTDPSVPPTESIDLTLPRSPTKNPPNHEPLLRGFKPGPEFTQVASATNPHLLTVGSLSDTPRLTLTN